MCDIYIPYIEKDLHRKAVLLAGPRQVGKSTLAKIMLTNTNGIYLNWDIAKHRKIIKNIEWDKSLDLVILDELHKMPKWKNYLKGIIDEFQNSPKIFVTGSARIDIFRKSGDALTGRYFLHKLHPIDLAESKLLQPKLSGKTRLMHLLKTGGFPEAYFNPDDAERLINDRFDIVVRDDIRDLSKINSITQLQMMVNILRDRGAGTFNYSSFAEDLSVSVPTIKNWFTLLEKFYLIFSIPPFTNSLARSLKKESRFYFFDCAAALDEKNTGILFENLVACSLKKYCDFKNSVEGKRFELKYFRDKEKREVDFVVTLNSKPYWYIECKTSDDNLSPHLNYLHNKIAPSHGSIQLVMNLERTKEINGIKIVNAIEWLENLYK